MKHQKVCELSLTGTPEQINSILDEGYEVTGIVPIHQTSGGAIYARTRGNYVLKVLVLLSPSDRRTRMEFKLVTRNNGYTNEFNKLLESWNELGYWARFVLPLDVFLDPEARAGIGKGTYGFAVFFIKDQETEERAQTESGMRAQGPE
ncbi:hypothetical protein DSECCO2_384650 [anaerobic digester metagenome]